MKLATSEIKVSVLMLTYNQEKYVAEAIRSVLLQETNFPFELLIGNDCSTDGTTAVCKAWKEKFPEQIVLFNRTHNLGLQQNFIQTYEQCRGKYIAICEGDDFWTDKHKLQKQVDFLDNHPAYSTCFHRVVNYYEENGTKSLSNGGQKADTGILDLAASNYISNVSAVFRRGLFGALPGWFAYVSTYDYAIHMLNAQYGRLYYMKKPMAVYRQRKQAIWSRTRTDKKLNISLQVRELLLNYFEPNDRVWQVLRNAYLQISLNLIRYYRSAQNEKMAVDTEKRILAYYPEWTLEQLRLLEVDKPLTFMQQMRKCVRRILTCARMLVSYLIPLPRI